MDGWMDGWVGGWVDGWMGGWVDGWMDGWIDGWLGGWKAVRWVVGWTDGWMTISEYHRSCLAQKNVFEGSMTNHLFMDFIIHKENVLHSHTISCGAD